MNLIDKAASPPQKLDTILLHIRNFRGPAARAGIDIAQCYVQFDCEYFGLSSYAEMKFYLNALIDRQLLDVLGDETIQYEEFHRKVSFPRRVRMHDCCWGVKTYLSPVYSFLR